MEIRTLLIDDEDLARQEMRHLLGAFPDFRILDEAADATDAQAKIRSYRPDLIFLDINMPGKSGFDLLAELEESPQVVFVTAYDEFAVRAFETNALDYLLKPVRPERLEKTVEAVREALRNKPESPPGQSHSLRPTALFLSKTAKNAISYGCPTYSCLKARIITCGYISDQKNRCTAKASTYSMKNCLPNYFFAPTGSKSSIWHISRILSRFSTAHCALRCAAAPGWKFPYGGPESSKSG